MLSKIITFALQQRMLVLICTIAMAISGWYAVQNLPIEAFPDVQDVQVIIVTQYPGQAPEEVERSITLPIEMEMNGIPRMTRLRSVSITGLAVVTITFSDFTNDYFARQQVLERLQNVTLPQGVQASIAPLTPAIGEIYRFYLDAPPEMPIYEVRAIEDWIVRPFLRQTIGLADVMSFGGTLKQYQVKFDPYLLKKYSLTVDQVADVLAGNSSNSGGGRLTRGDESLVIRSIGLFKKIEDIEQVAIASVGGQPIFVKDVAKVEVGERTRSGIVGYNERDDVVLGVAQITKGEDAAKVLVALKEQIKKLEVKLPKGVRLIPVYDRADLIKHTIHTVVENMILGTILVVTILMVFLRNWRAALIVASMIPLSLLFAFLLMSLNGVSANLISLGSVDFGIIIDSAVVLVEALMVKLATENTRPEHNHVGWRLRILRQTATEMAHPILFAKIIIILAFLPIFTFQRVENKIFSPMAFTLSFALLGTIILVLTWVPTLLSYTMRGQNMVEKHTPRWMLFLQNSYLAVLRFATRLRVIVIVLSLVLLGGTLSYVPQLGSEFLPKLDEGNIWLTIQLHPSTAMTKSKEVERKVREILRSYPEVTSVTSHLGRPDDGTDAKGPYSMEILANLAPKETWRFASKEEMIEDMTQKIKVMPGVPTNFSQVMQDSMEEALSGVKGELAIKIYGSDLDILEGKADQVASILNNIRGSADVAVVKIRGQTELNITIDRDRLVRYGIKVDTLNTIVQTALEGAEVETFFEGSRRFSVTLRLDQRFRESVEDISELPITLPAGGSIPLGEIATIELKQGASRISREGGERYVAIKSNLLGRDQGSFVEEAMNKVNEQLSLPPGYYVTWGGQFENKQRALKRLQIIVPLSLLFIYLLLFGAFNSMKKALLALLMIPFTFIGGIAALALAQLPLSISAAVGFIAVAGISVQNAVIMIEQIMELLRNGASLQESVMEGAVQRLRPILMTALMAGLGLLPAALSHGMGSETQRPFAMVIVGGVISATLFTLLLLPLLYPLFAREDANGYHVESEIELDKI
ncbi:MAG: CusA/CzcA family heavy metal efflux RND transporter [Thiotrichaceae bacterium]|nr:CusA/CzcA family heavy metal efflux RND transporter [Thiotrichaceae bacterium]